MRDLYRRSGVPLVEREDRSDMYDGEKFDPTRLEERKVSPGKTDPTLLEGKRHTKNCASHIVKSNDFNHSSLD